MTDEANVSLAVVPISDETKKAAAQKRLLFSRSALAERRIRRRGGWRPNALLWADHGNFSHKSNVILRKSFAFTGRIVERDIRRL